MKTTQSAIFGRTDPFSAFGAAAEAYEDAHPGTTVGVNVRVLCTGAPAENWHWTGLPFERQRAPNPPVLLLGGPTDALPTDPAEVPSRSTLLVQLEEAHRSGPNFRLLWWTGSQWFDPIMVAPLPERWVAWWCLA